jgi:hypothetical protein
VLGLQGLYRRHAACNEASKPRLLQQRFWSGPSRNGYRQATLESPFGRRVSYYDTGTDSDLKPGPSRGRSIQVPRFETNGLKHGRYAPEASSGPLGLLFGYLTVSDWTLGFEEFRGLLASTVEALLLCCTGEETATSGLSWESNPVL